MERSNRPAPAGLVNGSLARRLEVEDLGGDGLCSRVGGHFQAGRGNRNRRRSGAPCERFVLVRSVRMPAKDLMRGFRGSQGAFQKATVDWRCFRSSEDQALSGRDRAVGRMA